MDRDRKTNIQTDTATTEMSFHFVQFIQVTHTPTKSLT